MEHCSLLPVRNYLSCTWAEPLKQIARLLKRPVVQSNMSKLGATKRICRLGPARPLEAA